MRGTLAGLRVLDLSRLLPGPFLTQLLAELGADVVKVEAPGVGDETRLVPYAFDAVNGGKRSIVLDLKKPDAREVALRLAARSDVLVESFRPGVMDRFGLDDATLAAANPRLVRCSIVGYPAGEHRDDVGHDLNYQSLAGILHAPEPRPPPTQTADLGGALYAATAILAALWERERTGAGRRIEVALADAALAFNSLALARARAGEEQHGAWELTGAIPCYRVYRCADGAHVAFAALEARFFERFAQATGVDAALQYDPAGHTALETLFATRPAAEWVATLRKAGVPITPVLAPREVDAPAGPATPLAAPSRAPPPGLGEHTDAVLRELGYSDADVRRLRDAAVVA
ncbi:MAG TPA: CaiB/BaiF CoA-transferase family protein [Candidatus Thermoplasmatota archaeon]|nr:CaiB/BaiF CoA-transferase family protein [Candidatus Thermoplasmatota archaeon]